MLESGYSKFGYCKLLSRLDIVEKIRERFLSALLMVMNVPL